MASGSGTMLFRLLVFSAIATVSVALQPRFNCSSTSKCRSLIDYIPPNATTIAAVQSLFQVKHFLSFLGANNLPTNTSPSLPLPASQKIKVPFNCKCTNGTGLSDKRPIYKVQSGDSLDKIAEITFARLVTFQQIATANRIPDPSKIEVGQELWIPLPCSCDEVDGNRVVHYGHLVETGSSVSAIAGRYNVSEETILKLNGIADARSLQASQVLDIPLRACSSVIREDSIDFPFLLSNDTYDYTANNCVLCQCDAAKKFVLDCKPSQLNPSSLKSSNWSSCPAMACEGSSFLLGNSRSSGCNTTTCAYAGFSKQTIFTNISTLNTCPGPADNPNGASRTGSEGLNLAYLVALTHVLVFRLLLIQ
ncbi:unnamed protein product [Citrullus colocynthis]|uniref:LysM domain-containing protein n=1 Tax=Citrullus colocynthis TaxID=252529 RepID=A0ABP0YBK1_9ROSI